MVFLYSILHANIIARSFLGSFPLLCFSCNQTACIPNYPCFHYSSLIRHACYVDDDVVTWNNKSMRIYVVQARRKSHRGPEPDPLTCAP
jgi:hypothetical protein